VETGREVAVALLKSGKSGARGLLYLRPAGAAVQLRKGDPPFQVDREDVVGDTFRNGVRRAEAVPSLCAFRCALTFMSICL